MCLAMALWQLGHPEQALVRSEEGLAEAQELGHTATLAHTLHHSCMLRELLGDVHAAGAQATRLEELCAGQRLRYPSWLTMATLLRGADLVAVPCPPSRLADVHQCLASYRATGSRLFLPYWLALEARALAEAERAPEALTTLGEALRWVDRTDQRWMEAELHRVKGRVLLRLRSTADTETEAALRTAVTVARRQKARMWELRAARDLARLWAERGERRKALDLLAPVHGWFSEGAGMADLEEAEALLAGLR
jgi:predicted ATPase